MTIKINGDNTVANPGFSGDDTDTGLQVGTNELKLVTGGTTRATVDSSGRLLLGTTTEGHASADDLTIDTSGDTGMTIRSGTSNQGSVYFSDATSDAGEYAGWLRYSHSSNDMTVGTNGAERFRIASSGQIGLGGANYGTSGQVLTSNGSSSAPTWQDAAGGSTDKIEEGNTSVECTDSGSDGTIKFTIEGTQVGVFDSSGNLDCDKAVRGGTTSSTGFFSGDFRSNATAASGFGALYAQNNQSGGRVWTGAKADGTYTSEIFDDGSAKFDGSVSIGGDAAANTIDEYEEGTWTPSIGGNATYTTQEGNYIKIGHLVLAHFRLSINAQGTGSTIGSISGLPFNSAKAAQNTSALTFGSLGVSIAWGVYYVGANSSQMYFSYTTGAQASLTNNPNILTNGASINGTMIYYCS